MSRKVFISSDISIDEKLADVAEEDALAALLWPWFLTCFDDWGRSEASPKRLKNKVFPGNDLVTPDVITKALQLYQKHGLLKLYEVDGKQYMAVDQENWFKYQTHIRREKREKDGSKYPAPPDCAHVADDSAQVREDARDDAKERAVADDCIPSPSPSPSKKHIADSDEIGETFERFWKAYPKKQGKAAALKKWRTLYKHGKIDIEFILAKLQAYIAYVEAERRRGFDRQFMDGSTFVNQERWNDDWSVAQPRAPNNRDDYLAHEIELQRQMRDRNEPPIDWFVAQ